MADPRTVADILACVSRLWKLEADAEITCEANPTSADARRFQDFRAAGVNRLSVGVQSLRNADLVRLGRLHTAEQARAAYDAASAAFDNVTIDLIYGRQFQRLEHWEAELREAVSWKPGHLSIYQLTVEPGTAFDRRKQANKLPGLPSDSLSREFFILTQEICRSAGYRHYEISSYAQPGAEGRHNLLYWRGFDYLGIGPGAHGRLTEGSTRTATEAISVPEQWLKSVESTGSGEASSELLGAHERGSEYLLTALRLEEGVDIERYRSFDCGPIDESTVRELEEAELVELARGRLSATLAGRLLVDTISRALAP